MNKQEAANELLTRSLARQNLIDYIQYTYPGYIVEPAHLYICSVLDKFNSGEYKRLILCAPPRFGKSEIVSVRSPAHYIGRTLPTSENASMILCSYTADLAVEKSREVRNSIETNEFSTLFPRVVTADDSRAVNNWEAIYTNKDGKVINRAKFIAAGVGGGITGFGASRAVVDDPIKNMEEAMSVNLIDKLITWHKTALRTRLTPNAGICIMGTRWFTDDYIGRLLKERTEDWVVVRLPALSETQEVRDKSNERIGLSKGLLDPLLREPGKALTPVRGYNEEWLEDTRTAIGELYFQAMYQNVPTVAEGNLFKRDYFRILNFDGTFDPYSTKNMVRIRYWDKAASQDVGCWSAGVLVSYSFITRKFRIEDVKRFRYNALAREQIIRQTAEEDYKTYNGTVDTWTEQEPGSGGKESAETTVINLAGYSIFIDKVNVNKDIRLQPYLSQAMGGNIELLHARWNEDFITEHLEIPNGLYRDQSDAAGGAINKLILKRANRTYIAAPIVSHMPVTKY